MSNEEKKKEIKKFTFNVARGGGKSPRSYTKTEDKLDHKETDLLLGTLVNEFNKMPEIVKTRFMMMAVQTFKTQKLDNILDKVEDGN